MFIDYSFIVGVLLELSIQDTLGVIGFFLALLLGGLQVYSYYYQRPRLSIGHEEDSVKRPRRAYGYLNLVITNNGKRVASHCKIRLTINASQFQNQVLWWLDPKDVRTKKEEYVDIYGEDDIKVTNLFEIDADKQKTFITSKGGHKAPIKIGEEYIFKISVFCTPSGKASSTLKVKIHSWDRIKVM